MIRRSPQRFGVSAEVVALLRNAGLPITTAWLLVDTACHWMIITVPPHWRDVLPGISTAEFVHRIGELMSTSRVGHMCPVTYVLDDDIDPSNTSDVLWALGYPHTSRISARSTGRCRSCRGISATPKTNGTAGAGRSSYTTGCSPRSRMGERAPRPSTASTRAEIRERVLAAEPRPVTGPRGRRRPAGCGSGLACLPLVRRRGPTAE